jgi:hypothetical protein
MNDFNFIFNALPTQGATIPTWFPVLGGLQYNSPLIGSFLGVISAFGINYIAHRIKNYRDKMYYKKTLSAEIKDCIENCEKFVGDEGIIRLLSIDRWTSAMNSGALRFFSVDEVDGLSRIYHKIRKFNSTIEMRLFYENSFFLEELKRDGEDLLKEYRECLRLEVDWVWKNDALDQKLKNYFKKIQEKIKKIHKWWQF